MNKFEVLTQLEDKKISPKEAYELLFIPPIERKPRRASFIKASIRIPDQKGVNVLLSVLLILPIPIFIIKWIVARRKNFNLGNQFEIEPKELIDLISLKGVKVMIHAKSKERILLRTI
jgi:hypothetical protein